MRLKPALFCTLCMLITISVGCSADAPTTETYDESATSNESVRTLTARNEITDICIDLKYGDVIVQSNSSCSLGSDSDEVIVSVGISKYLPDVSVHTGGHTLFVDETKKMPVSAKQSYPLYLYLPDDPGIRTLSINSENSNVSLSDGINIDTLSVYLKTAGDIKIDDAVISNLSLYTLTGPISVNLTGGPDTYDYELSTESGNPILLNGTAYDNTDPDSIQPDVENHVIVSHGRPNKIQASTQGTLTVQVE